MVAALDIKSPEIISSIINGEKVTTNMISESQKAPTVPKHKIKRHIRFKNNTTNNALPSDSDDAME